MDKYFSPQQWHLRLPAWLCLTQVFKVLVEKIASPTQLTEECDLLAISIIQSEKCHEAQGDGGHGTAWHDGWFGLGGRGGAEVLIFLNWGFGTFGDDQGWNCLSWIRFLWRLQNHRTLCFASLHNQPFAFAGHQLWEFQAGDDGGPSFPVAQRLEHSTRDRVEMALDHGGTKS